MKGFLLVIILTNSNFVFAQTPQLLFESGFEPSTIATTSGFYKWGITGYDSTSGYNWNTDLGALDFTRAGNMSGNNDNTFGVTDIAEIITDPDNENNKVLHFEQHSAPVGSARISAAMLFDWGVGYGGTDYFQQGYVRYRMKLSDGYTALPSLTTAPIDWLNINEIWEYDAAGHPGDWSYQTGRWSMDLHKDYGSGQVLYWYIHYEQYLPTRYKVWEVENRSVSVPTEQWFTLEYFFKRGDASTGRIIVSITPDGGSKQTVFDITNWTQHQTESGYRVTDWAPFKQYTIQWVAELAYNNGTPLGIYYDNFEFWNNIPGITAEESDNLPDKFVLYQNYPNPFNPATTIEYSIPVNSSQYEAGSKQFPLSGTQNRESSIRHQASSIQNPVPVSLKVYDILGREVATLVNENQRPGNYTVRFDASNLSSGTYIYRLTAGSFAQIRKMILLR